MNVQHRFILSILALVTAGMLFSSCGLQDSQYDIYAPFVARQPTPTATKTWLVTTTATAVRSPLATLTATSTPTRVYDTFLVLPHPQPMATATPTATPTRTPVLVRLPVIDIGVTSTPQPPATVVAPPAAAYAQITFYEDGPVQPARAIRAVAYVYEPPYTAWSPFYAQHPQSSPVIQLRTSDNVWRGAPVVALTQPSQWIEAVCLSPANMVGVQFWGDENDGWAHVLVDGVEYWRGNTYGQAPNLFAEFLEISRLPNGLHTIRVEPIGQLGTTAPGGNIHVTVYAFVCGLQVQSSIYLPVVKQRR